MEENAPVAGVATELLPQRWICLVAMVVTLFCMQFALIITPGIAPHIIPEMGLTPAQFGMLANMPYLAGVLFGIVAGNWGDRIGVKKIMTYALIFFIIGAAWRAYAGSYLTLMISSLVMGLGLAVLNANSTKGIRLWFPGKSMGVAMGIYVAGASLGAGVALKCGAIWGTHLSFMIAAGGSILAAIVWVLLYRTHPAESDDSSQTVTAGAFKSVMKNKDVWIISLLIMFTFGNSTTFQTYMNAGLAISSEGNMALIGTISLVSTIVVAASSILMPAFIARFKNLRTVMIVICVFEAVCSVLFIALPFGPWTWIMVVLAGLGLGTMLAMGKTVPALLPDIDPRNLGAVGGLQSTLQNLGGWVIAGYIIAPIAQGIYPSLDGGATFGLDCYIAIYIGAAICTLLVAVCYALLPKSTPTHLVADSEE